MKAGCTPPGTIPVLLIAILVLASPAAAGFTVSYAIVTPPGDLEDGTPVTVICDIPRDGVQVYDQLVFTTDLNSPLWEPVLVVRDKETPVTPASANGNRLVINGAVFNYPPPVSVNLRVGVSGTVPLNHTTHQALLRIQQIDADGTGYAFPSGYSLPMPGSPDPEIPATVMVPAPPEETLAAAGTAPATPGSVTTTSTTVPAVTDPGRTVSLPTPFSPAVPGTTPAAAAPAGPLPIAGAAGIALALFRKSTGP